MIVQEEESPVRIYRNSFLLKKKGGGRKLTTLAMEEQGQVPCPLHAQASQSTASMFVAMAATVA